MSYYSKRASLPKETKSKPKAATTLSTRLRKDNRIETFDFEYEHPRTILKVVFKNNPRTYTYVGSVAAITQKLYKKRR